MVGQEGEEPEPEKCLACFDGFALADDGEEMAVSGRLSSLQGQCGSSNNTRLPSLLLGCHRTHSVPALWCRRVPPRGQRQPDGRPQDPAEAVRCRRQGLPLRPVPELWHLPGRLRPGEQGRSQMVAPQLGPCRCAGVAGALNDRRHLSRMPSLPSACAVHSAGLLAGDYQQAGRPDRLRVVLRVPGRSRVGMHNSALLASCSLACLLPTPCNALSFPPSPPHLARLLQGNCPQSGLAKNQWCRSCAVNYFWADQGCYQCEDYIAFCNQCSPCNSGKVRALSRGGVGWGGGQRQLQAAASAARPADAAASPLAAGLPQRRGMHPVPGWLQVPRRWLWLLRAGYSEVRRAAAILHKFAQSCS